jgi:hypothetical protein
MRGGLRATIGRVPSKAVAVGGKRVVRRAPVMRITRVPLMSIAASREELFGWEPRPVTHTGDGEID